MKVIDKFNQKYDVIVIGGGHAGIEAASISAKQNCKTLLITLSIDKIGLTPCNPSIGGPAKGIVTKEIDALGGLQARISDQTTLQMKMLNLSKGPVAQAYRSQIDKSYYCKVAQEFLKQQKNLTILEKSVQKLLIKRREVKGVVCKNEIIYGDVVILTTGTYMAPVVYKGHSRYFQGPINIVVESDISKQLKHYGFKLNRLKTGTPPRIAKDSINYQKLKIDTGNPNLKFSFFTNKSDYHPKNINCYLTKTTLKTKKLIEDNIESSPFYVDRVKLGIGPRYCPSIEDKIIKFPHHKTHHIFLEPESIDTNLMYVQGFSTSLPETIQDKIIPTIIGLENAKILQYGYAIEYDALNPIQLKLTLETKLIKNLFTAGQINSTSGYEEAAGQGIIAGINAAMIIKKQPPLILSRSNSYIGVMIDDLIFKGAKEPYRLLTSRCEFRLLVRSDNAIERLSPIALKLKLLTQTEIKKVKNHIKKLTALKTMLENKNLLFNNQNKKYSEHLKEISSNKIEGLYQYFQKSQSASQDISFEMFQNASYDIKLSGYISAQKRQVLKFLKLEGYKLPKKMNYSKITTLSLEAKEKFSKFTPQNIGQAMRIEGISLNDVTTLFSFIKNNKNNQTANDTNH